jgi:hypothetical protein
VNRDYDKLVQLVVIAETGEAKPQNSNAYYRVKGTI